MTKRALRVALSIAVLAATWVGADAPARADEPSVGMMLDAGVPDGAHGSLVYRPRGWLRLHAGGGYNMIGKGVRGGLTLMPLQTVVRPAIIVEAGRYFEGDANPLMQRITGDDEAHHPVLSRVGYDYANAHLGLEFGSRRATFYVHAGYSKVQGAVRNLNAALDDGGGDGEMSASVQFQEDPRVRATIPSARIGIIIYVH